MILLKLIRKYKKATYTIGNLLVDGAFFCDTLEDKDRGLKAAHDRGEDIILHICDE